MGEGQRAAMEWRWRTDRDRRRFRRRKPRAQRAHIGRSELRSLVRAAVLFYGAFDLTATAKRNQSIPGLQQQLSTYVGGVERLLHDPRVSPLRAVASGKLPPCFIIGAGDDSWCLADSLTLAQALSAALNPYELHVMEGMPHGFMQMSALDGCRAARRLMWDFLGRNV